MGKVRLRQTLPQSQVLVVEKLPSLFKKSLQVPLFAHFCCFEFSELFSFFCVTTRYIVLFLKTNN